MAIYNAFASILLALIAWSVSTFFHETAHALMCKVMHCKLISVKALFLFFDGKKLSFQLKGKNHCAFSSSSKRTMKVIVAAGPLIEFIICIICMLGALAAQQAWIRNGLWLAAFFIFVSIIYNLLPMANGDGRLLFGKGES